MDWDELALAAAGIDRERLSTTVPTTYCAEGLPAGIAEQMGLAIDTPFVVGASDGVLQISVSARSTEASSR